MLDDGLLMVAMVDTHGLLMVGDGYEEVVLDWLLVSSLMIRSSHGVNRYEATAFVMPLGEIYCDSLWWPASARG